MIRLVCKAGPHSGEIWELVKESITIGRDANCDVSLNDPKISRVHCEIHLTGDEFIFTDNNSTNGSYVNNIKISEKAIKYGDKITVGNSVFLFAGETKSDTVKFHPSVNDNAIITTTTSVNSIDSKIIEIEQELSKKIEETRATVVPIKDFKELEKLNRNLRILYQTSKRISNIMALEELYDLIIDDIFMHLTDAEGVCLFGIEKETNQFIPKASQNKEGRINQPFQVSRTILETTRRDRVGIIASDASTDKRFDASHSILDLKLRSVMCVPMEVKGNVIGAIYVDNRNIPNCFNTNDLELLTILASQAAISIENASLYEEIQKTYFETIVALGNTIEAKDKYTRGHTERVSKLALGTAKELDLSNEQIKNLRTAAELHDIGKIAIQGIIIRKKSGLSDEEFEIIKQHPVKGCEILKPIEFLDPVLPIIKYHHERYDGSGYPEGLKGNESPIEARILNLVDAFDAMTTQRPYNKPLTIRQALVEVKKQAGISFDPDIVDAFLRFMAKNSQTVEE